ncbi:DUF2218 domain-containing protein [Oryzobacter terrae]|uniref:DUF2218 domain-containing protein n=1 Tax=Oryzobacter terrae TaxID=1620385 RepID=UPI0036709EBC
MSTLTGTIPTPRGARYAKQLAGHWREKAEVTERPDGSVAFLMEGGASATLTPREDDLRVEASSAEFGEVVRRHLERFGTREELTLVWDDEA